MRKAHDAKVEMSPARAYLEQLAGDGVYDSSGSFTVGKKTALGKLGAFQLPRESAWILKVVQCAVAWGADDIDVKQGRSRTSFAFAASEPFDLDGVRQAMTSTDCQGEDYVQHLAVGLRAVGSGQNRPFGLHVYAGDSVRILRWDGETLFFDVETLKVQHEGWVVDLRVDFDTRGSGGFFRSGTSVQKAAEEGSELSTNAAVCPIPLRLDGRRLDLLTPPLPGQKTSSVAQLCLAWSEPAEEELLELRLPSGVSFKEPMFTRTNRLIDKRVYLIAGNQRNRASQFLVRLSYHYDVNWNMQEEAYEPNTRVNQASWLHGVRDGVVCDSKQLVGEKSNVRADIYYSARGLATDISGLSLIEKGEEIFERRREASSFAGSSIDLLERRLAGHGGPYMKVGGLVGAGLLVTLAGGPIALIGGVIFSPAFIMAGIEVIRANALLRRLVEDIQRNLRSLRKNLR